LSAIRALTEFYFLQLPGYSILGGWLVIPEEADVGNDDFRSLIPTLPIEPNRRDLFRMSVTLAANGDLYISPERNAAVSVRPVNTSKPPAEGTSILLSPSGKQVAFLSVLPSTSQTLPILQKLRSTLSLEVKPPFVRIRLPSGVETLWPGELCFQQYISSDSYDITKVDYFTFTDGLSSAVKLVSDALTYKPAPAPSPAIPPPVAAHVTPSGVYHTPPDGIVRAKGPQVDANATAAQPIQEEWAGNQEEGYWPALQESRGDADVFDFADIDDGFDVREEDFNFFDDEPSEDFQNEEPLVAEVPIPTETQVEGMGQPMEDVKEELPSPPRTVEEPVVLSPPYSPLRILPSPPPTRRGTMPRVWDHVHLSGDIDNNKYGRGGKYWCEELDETAKSDETLSSSSSDYEDFEPNPRKRKREDDDGDIERKNGVNHWNQGLDSEEMIRAIEENSLMTSEPLQNFNGNQKTTKRLDANELDPSTLHALVDCLANQVSWNPLNPCVTIESHQELPMTDLKSVISNIWGTDAIANITLKEWTETTDTIPLSDEDDSQQPTKTPRMKALKSPHVQNTTFSLTSNLEQTPSLYPIPSPFFLIHRIINRNSSEPNHVQRLAVLPPALRFWEKLSFSPVSGEKHVRCYVVHPDSEGMSSAVDVFLSELQTAWSGAGMGKFERGKVGKDGTPGMVTVSLPANADEGTCITGYQDALLSLGMFLRDETDLARGISSASDKWLENVLIIMVNPFCNQSIIIPFCRAFLNFKSTYHQVADNPALVPDSNLALQILPASLLATKEGIITQGLQFQLLVRTLYDRCTVSATSIKKSENKADIKPAVTPQATKLTSATNIQIPHCTSNGTRLPAPYFTYLQRLLSYCKQKSPERLFDDARSLHRLVRQPLDNRGVVRRLGPNLLPGILLL
jgi:MID domain of medPIWI